jgi:hypothetical protein
LHVTTDDLALLRRLQTPHPVLPFRRRHPAELAKPDSANTNRLLHLAAVQGKSLSARTV